MIRPKMYLADGSNNYRENRWFTAWPPANKDMIEFQMPDEIAAIIGQKNTLFGNGVIQCNDVTIACETCEEIFVPDNPHIRYGLDAVDIIGNGSGSHHELRKLN
jgi:NAD+ synthase (glutamine-hydrolysing)